MTSLNDPQSRGFARLTGAAYLTIAVAGGFSIAYVPSVLYVAGDPAASVQNILAHRGFFLAGIAGDVVMMLAEIAVTAMLFFMFRPVQPVLSLAAALARFAMVAVMAAMLFFHVGALALADPSYAMAGVAMPERLAFAGVMLTMHDAGVWIWQVFFFAHLVVLGALVLRPGAYPRLLGAGLMVGAFGYLLDSVFAFAFPDFAALGYARAGLLVIVTLSEIGFAIWLLAVGPRAAARDPGALPA
ncbi:hypothetical protein AIOL_001612 [Candidatus Rhodobacter oscarellae]|uniref:DUF4386 domain-containing protein n=1 Tax=Candidatus Rhodobacter oscarellae TaxID=1675527 RepID=A0A0J9GT48_9RHOB|nr:DUF4386 domain-containing protein [Candidatus Rhodobacter lobularis]KMW56658.1 hypothetical protein AIOL_001612 [Candidatus Rhodobacter lobularis]